MLHCIDILLESWFSNIGFNALQIYDVAHVKKELQLDLRVHCNNMKIMRVISYMDALELSSCICIYVAWCWYLVCSYKMNSECGKLFVYRITTFRNTEIDKWQRKIQVTTGAAALKGKLHAFNQVACILI